MIVKEWKPAEGCKACENAKRIMDDHRRISMGNHSKSLKKIKELMDKLEDKGE